MDCASLLYSSVLSYSDKLLNLHTCWKMQKEAFIKNDHPRFRREIAAIRHMSYGTATVYAEGIRNASKERIARLVKIVVTPLSHNNFCEYK